MPTTLVTDAWRKPLLWTAAVAVALVATLAVLVHRSSTAFDTWIYRELYRHIGTSGASSLLDVSSPRLSIALLAVVVLFGAILRRWDIAALAVLGPAAAMVCTEWVLKPLIGRPLVIGAYTVRGVFPSGHETIVSATAFVLLIVLGRLPLRPAVRGVGVGLLATWTLLAAVGLVRNYWHYATDTIGGCCVSVAVVSSIALGIDWLGARLRRSVSSPDARTPASTTRAA